MHKTIYTFFPFFICELIMRCDCGSATYNEPQITGNFPVKIGLSPTILKVFIKRNVLANDLEKMLQFYSKDDKTQVEADSNRNPMMDYLEKIYSFRNYDLLRPYRSIFRGLKTLGKRERTTKSSLLKSLRKGQSVTDDYWELNEPIQHVKIPYHRLREKSRLAKLRSVPSSATTISSGGNTTNSIQSPTHKKHHFKSVVDVLGRREMSTPPDLHFCDKPCDALEEDEAKLSPKPSTVEPEQEETTHSSGDGCDNDYQDVEVFAHKDSTDVINIPFNKHSGESDKHSYEFGLKEGVPLAHHNTTHNTTKPPKLKVFTGTANPLVWTLPPHPILDKNDVSDVISTRLHGGGDTPGGTPQPPVSAFPVVVTSPSPCPVTESCSTRHPFCMPKRGKPQKIIVRISSTLGEVPVVIMRDNRTCGVSLSLVNDFILDEKNNLYKKTNHRNTLLTIKSKLKFNQSMALPEIKISRKTGKNHHKLAHLPLLRPQPLMGSPLFAVPPRPYPFPMQPLNPRVYGFPDTEFGPQVFPQPYSLGFRPPLLPLYFTGRGLQEPILPPRSRFDLKVE